MKNKNICIVFVVLLTPLLLVGTGCFDKRVDKKSEKKEIITVVTSNTKKGNFIISPSSTVKYSVRKEWLKKPTEIVEGTSNSVKGSIVYSTSSSILSSVEVDLDTASFNSKSTYRDDYVIKLLGKSVTIKSVTSTLIDINNKQHKVLLNLQINNVNKEVEFAVTGTIEQDKIKASGVALIKMSDFNIKAPSVLNIYSVNDKLEIMFDIVASRLK